MKLNFCPECFAEVTGDICLQCGYTCNGIEVSPIILAPGTILAGKYKIGRLLGIGGFGITYLCYDITIGKRYAIKEYMPKDIAIRQEDGSILSVSKDSEEILKKGLDMFLYETNILVTLSGNKGIVEVYDFILENNTAYLIMEYLDGISVKMLMKSRNNLDYNFALDILSDISVALKVVHSKGLLHRDISPENIMILKDGSVKLIDFGASRFFVGERSKSLSLVLKPGFAPPEQYSSTSHQGEWTDIYALAATYYKMITGLTLPDALSRADNDTVERLDVLVPEIKPHIAKAIKKALAINYRERYKNVDQFISAMKFDSNTPKPNDSIEIQTTVTKKKKKWFFRKKENKKIIEDVHIANKQLKDITQSENNLNSGQCEKLLI